MSVQYRGEHSITFIKNGVSPVVKRSWVDWHLIPVERPFVVPPAPIIQIISVPGSNRTIDLTELVSGSVVYGRRIGTWEFYIDHAKWDNWSSAYRTITDFINGAYLYCVLEDKHNKAYRGRLSINDWQNGSTFSKIVIGYNFEYGETENTFVYPLTKSVTSISAVYNQKRRITTDSSLDDLRKDLRVNALFDNGTTDEIDYYTLSGSLSTTGTRTITAKCNNKTATFGVNVSKPYRNLAYYNYDGLQLLYTELVVQGDNGSYAGVPSRSSTAQYTYTFIGWSTTKNATTVDANATKNVTSDRSVYAVYSQQTRTYSLKYYNYDGTQLINTDTMTYGGNGTYTGTPERASTAQYDFTFIGWSTTKNATTVDANATKNITSDRNVYAAYSHSTRSYQLKYYDAFGSELLYTDTVTYGGNGTYTGTPARASTAQYDFTFVGWATYRNATSASVNATKNITSDKSVYAAYSRAIKSYTLSYYSYDGESLLYYESVQYDGEGTYAGTPGRASTAQYDFDFAGWSTLMNSDTIESSATKYIRSNRNVYAVYSRRTRSYSLKYYNYDGTTLLNTDTVAYGGNGTYTGTPTRENDSQYVYTFDGWSTSKNATVSESGATENITSNRNVYAAYSRRAIVNPRTLSYYNYDGSQLVHSEVVENGGDGIYSGRPDREYDPDYNYRFIGWSTFLNSDLADQNAVRNITTNRSVYAAYEELNDIPQTAVILFDEEYTLSGSRGHFKEVFFYDVAELEVTDYQSFVDHYYILVDIAYSNGLLKIDDMSAIRPQSASSHPYVPRLDLKSGINCFDGYYPYFLSRSNREGVTITIRNLSDVSINYVISVYAVPRS